MKPSKTFNMKKSTKRMIALMEHQNANHFKQAMIVAQLYSELRPKVKEKKAAEATDE